MSNIVLDREVGGYRYIESNGNPIVAYNDKECFFTTTHHYFRGVSNSFSYAERALERLRGDSIQASFERKIATPEYEILFFQGNRGYVILCFFTDKQRPFVVSFHNAIKELNEEQLKKGKELEDKAFFEIALSWEKGVKERISEWEKEEEERKSFVSEASKTFEESCRASNDFVFRCLECGRSVCGEYDTDSFEYSTCEHCGTRFQISAEAEVEIKIQRA